MTEGSPNEIIVRRFLEEVWNERKFDLIEELIDPNCLTHQLRSGAETSGVPRGPDAIKTHIQQWLAGFPDLKLTVEQMFSEADRVFSQSVMRETHTGEWLGLPPTRKQIAIRMMTVHRITDGKISADWVLVESLGFFQQLGLIALSSFPRNSA